MCFVNAQSSLLENVAFSVCARMCNAPNVIFIIWHSISGLDTWYHFRLNISWGVAVTMSGHQSQKNIRYFLRGGEGGDVFEGWANF